MQDCAVVPWFVRGYIMEHFRGIQLPPSDCPKVRHCLATQLPCNKVASWRATQNGFRKSTSLCSPTVDEEKLQRAEQHVCLQLSKWMEAAMKRPSVTTSFRPPEEGASYKDKLLEHYIRYADGTANSTSAAAFK